MGKLTKLDSELLNWVQERLGTLLPANWQAEPVFDIRGRPDLALRVKAPDGASALVVFEAKSPAEPKEALSAVEQLRKYEGYPVLVAPFLSRRTRDLLAEAAVGYIDMTGNVLLQLDRPALYVRSSGKERNPWLGGRPVRSLRGSKAARIVRLLCDTWREQGVTDIARATETDTGYVSRVLEVLERDALIERALRGPVRRVAWEGLIRRWVDDYKG